ncbi:MAG: hypothetical protein ACTH31_09225, partial [Pseudoclavibacter sp.]
MSEGDGSGAPPVYGGGRRTRGVLSRTNDRHSADDSHPTVPDAVRYFPSTGQIQLPGASVPHGEFDQTSPKLGAGPSEGPRVLDGPVGAS